MIKTEPIRTALRVELEFDKPVFNWQGAADRFFSMIYEALSESLPVKSEDFSAVAANRLNQVRATYAIYGGTSSVWLSPDALVFDFPKLLIPEDRSIVREIMQCVHDAFPNSFPENKFQSLRLSSYEHSRIVDEKPSVPDYLSRFAFLPQTELPSAVVVHPGAKFEVLSDDPKWRCSVGVERSYVDARAIFATFNMNIDDADKLESFEQKVELVRDIAAVCEQLLGIK